jgi:uncharacterized repeat protein (TIGR01451 family)
LILKRLIMRKIYTLFLLFFGLMSSTSFGQIVANDDTSSPINGSTGGSSVINVLNNDTLNGVTVSSSQVLLTVVTPANSVWPGSPVPSVSPTTGVVTVNPGTPAGTYTITYQICEVGNTTNCDTAVVTIGVTASPIDAVNDLGNSTTSMGGVVFSNVLSNDTLNGAPVIPSQVSLTIVTNTNPGVTLSGTSVVVAPGTPPGNYTLVYQICEILNPANCDVATVTINVANNNSILNAVDDGPISINSGNQPVFVLNVITNDTLNGNPVTTANTDVTPITNGPISIGADGEVIIAAFTPQGIYSATYEICEINPTTGLMVVPANCDTALVTISVNDNIDAIDDSGTPINGFTGGTSFTNVLANDTLNGASVVPSQVTTTFVSSTNVGVTLSGTNVVVAPGTPAGFYTLTYQICENANPNNCDLAQVSVPVTAANINANDDGSFTFNITNGGTTPNILLNDTLNNAAILSSQITLSMVSMTTPWFQFNSNGTITLPVNSGIQSGTYTVTYQICENLNPTNCDTAIVTIIVVNNLTISSTSIYNDFNNDGFVNVGDVINYQITVSNIGSTTLTNLIACQSSMNVSGGTLASLNIGESNSTFFTGVHVITQAEINANNVNDFLCICGDGGVQSCSSGINTPLGQSNGIKLQAFFDTNNNGIKDASEIFYNGGTFNYMINGGPTSNLSSNNGIIYLYESNPATTYNFNYTTLNANYSSLTTYSNITVPIGSGITTYNFPITVIPYTDVQVFLSQYLAPPRPGFTYQNIIYLKNNSVQTITSGTLTFTKNDVVSITSIPSGAIANPNGFTLSYSNLLPNETRSFVVSMLVPTIPTVALGQLLTNSVSATIPVNDVNVNNNTSSLTQTIVGSYDPNDKQESHGGRIVHSTFTANDYLTYTIRFENTGTAEAINVKVDDVLDAQLDETSLQMVASSHDYVLRRVGNNLSWRFDGINLPPSVPNTQIGHGFITFQIKPKPDYAIGDIIPNFAEIYFDFNPAIITNTCTTEFVETLGNDNFAFANLNYFPNPIKNNLSISNNSIIDSAEITSILGQNMLSQKVNSLQTEINLSNFPKGIYFVKVKSKGNEKVIKIIKE